MTQLKLNEPAGAAMSPEMAKTLQDIKDLCEHKSKQPYAAALARQQIPWSYQLFITLCTTKTCHHLLPKLVTNIPEGKKYDFLRCVFDHRKDIAPRIRLQVMCEGRRFQPSCDKWNWMDGDTPLEQSLELIKAACAASRTERTLQFYTKDLDWSNQFFDFLCARKDCHRLLPQICPAVPGIKQFDFLHVAFANRTRLPHDILLKLWALCWQCRPVFYFSFQGISRWKDDTKPLGSYTPEQLEELKDSPLTDPLLIDSYYVCQRYCLVKKPGWEMLRYRFPGRRSVELHRTPHLQNAILEDSASAFCIACDMAGQRISYSLLLVLIRHGAKAVFAHLLDSGKLTQDIIPLPELCCLLASEKNWDTLPFLQTIEERHPNMLKDIHDALGLNLLWYALHGKNKADNPVINSLLQWGCDPQNTNPLGFTWQEASEAYAAVNRQ